MIDPGGQRGFTLLEILVALALVGILFVGVGAIQERRLQAQWHLEERIAAAQVGWNRMEIFQLELAEYRRKGTLMEPGLQEGEEVMAGKTFPWRRQLVALGEDEGFEVTIFVGDVDADPIHVERWRWRQP